LKAFAMVVSKRASGRPGQDPQGGEAEKGRAGQQGQQGQQRERPARPAQEQPGSSQSRPTGKQPSVPERGCDWTARGKRAGQPSPRHEPSWSAAFEKCARSVPSSNTLPFQVRAGLRLGLHARKFILRRALCATPCLHSRGSRYWLAGLTRE
jgi:hypothetical protein